MQINKIKSIFFLTFMSSLFLFTNCSVNELAEYPIDAAFEFMKEEALSWDSPSDDPNAVVYLSTSRTYSQEILDEVERLESAGSQVIYMDDRALKEMLSENPESLSNSSARNCISNAFSGSFYDSSINTLFYNGWIETTAATRWYGVAVYNCGTPYYLTSSSGSFDFYGSNLTPPACGTWVNNRVFAYCNGWKLGHSAWSPL